MEPAPVPFVPRPWPRRLPEESPLRGHRVLVLSCAVEVARRRATALSKCGASAQAAGPGEGLQALLSGTPWEVVVVDEVLLDGSFGSWANAATPTLVLVGAEDEQRRIDTDAVESLAAIIHAYLSPPIADSELIVAIGGALESRALSAENRRLRESLSDRFSLGSFTTRSPAMQRVLETAGTVADTRASILLAGESGTGKTMLAHTIHQLSPRREAPFVVVNCGSLPDQLLESELFGHVRGAFTGAVRDKPGRFEIANGGTIFLDEINSASLDLQVKLLRVIQDRAFERVGDTEERRVDVRLITATNRKLADEIEAGRFREDLFYRINVVRLEMPPLRERIGDTPLLVDAFLERFAAEYGKPIRGLDPDALAAVVAHPWPGNVRQLENTIERAVLVTRGERLTLADLPDELREFHAAASAGTLDAPLAGAGSGDAGGSGDLTLRVGLEGLGSLKRALEGPEKAIIRHALRLTGGNRKKTAALLDVNRTTLFNKMKKYGLMETDHGRD